MGKDQASEIPYPDAGLVHGGADRLDLIRQTRVDQRIAVLLVQDQGQIEEALGVLRLPRDGQYIHTVGNPHASPPRPFLITDTQHTTPPWQCGSPGSSPLRSEHRSRALLVTLRFQPADSSRATRSLRSWICADWAANRRPSTSSPVDCPPTPPCNARSSTSWASSGAPSMGSRSSSPAVERPCTLRPCNMRPCTLRPCTLRPCTRRVCPPTDLTAFSALSRP